eukprot:2292285-Pyramimonas_sp.AAC.1
MGRVTLNRVGRGGMAQRVGQGWQELAGGLVGLVLRWVTLLVGCLPAWIPHSDIVQLIWYNLSGAINVVQSR